MSDNSIDLLTNVSGTERDIENRKVALQTEVQIVDRIY